MIFLIIIDTICYAHSPSVMLPNASSLPLKTYWFVARNHGGHAVAISTPLLCVNQHVNLSVSNAMFLLLPPDGLIRQMIEVKNMFIKASK